MDNILDRVRYLHSISHLSQAEFARRLDLDPSQISKILSGKLPVSKSFVNRIVIEMGISKSWLVNGSGTPYSKEEQPRTLVLDDKDEYELARQQTPAGHGTPVYDIDVTAGCVELSRMFTNDRITGYVDLPRLNPDSVLVRVSGDSMTPIIPDGALISIRPVPIDGILSWGSIYVVVTDDYRFVKYLRRDRNSPDNVLLHSANPEYDDIELERSEIRSLFMVENVITFRTLQ